MTDVATPTSTPDPEDRLTKALADFEGKATTLINDFNGHKVTLLDGTSEQPSIVKQLTEARDQAKKLVEEINGFHSTLHDPAKNDGKAVSLAVPETVVAIREAKGRIDQMEVSIKEYQESLLGKKEGEKEVPGIKQDMEAKVNEITELHSKVYEKRGDQAPVGQAISEFLEEFTRKKGELDTIKGAITGYQDSLLGNPQDDGERKGGVKGKVEDYLSQLDQLTEKSKTQMAKLLKDADDLLQQSGIASMAHDSKEQKEAFVPDNIFWRRVLLGAFAALMLSFLIPINWILGTTFEWWVQALVKLPFIGGAVWAAVYAGKQLSQNKRLQQEYAHKENVAKIYYSLKKEVEDLEGLGLAQDVRKEVILTLVKSVGTNPSSTLESRSHIDKGPWLEALAPFADNLKQLGEKAPDLLKALIEKKVGQ